MKKAYSVKLNGAHYETVFATSSRAAIAQVKRRMDIETRPNFKAKIKLTAEYLKGS